jgi:hypothetical protein
MCIIDFVTVGAEIPIFLEVVGIAAIGFRCMCWKTHRTEAAGPAQAFDLLLILFEERDDTASGVRSLVSGTP